MFVSVVAIVLVLLLTVAHWTGDVPFREDPTDSWVTVEATRVSTLLNAAFLAHPEASTIDELATAAGGLPGPVTVFGNLVPVEPQGLTCPGLCGQPPRDRE